MKYPCTSVNGICWEGTWALVSTFVASIYLSHLEMKHWWHTETCCRIFEIRIVPFSTSALNRRAFKEEALPCSVSDFSHFSLILLNLTADCRPVHLYAVLTRSGIFCPKSLYNAPRQSHSRDKKSSPDEMRYDGVVIARRFITCVLIVLFIFNVYGRIYTPPEWRK